MSDRTHYVYEAYDADGICLYVGCTGNPPQRYRDHMRGNGDARGWFNPFVTNWRVAGPFPKAVAFRVEKERIALRQPVWNGHSIGNRGSRESGSTLINDYLAFHGVCFVDDPFGSNRPVLVPVSKRSWPRGRASGLRYAGIGGAA